MRKLRLILAALLLAATPFLTGVACGGKGDAEFGSYGEPVSEMALGNLLDALR